jgi:hypothetical protein
LTYKAENRAKIIRKNDTPKPGTVDEARSLENFLVLSGELRFTLRIVQRYFIWCRPGVALVYLKKLGGDVLNVEINN